MTAIPTSATGDFNQLHENVASDAIGSNEGRAHDHHLVGTTVPERLRGGVRWRIRTGPRLKRSE